MGSGYNYNFPLPRERTTDELYCETLKEAAEVIRDHAEVDYLIVRSVCQPLIGLGSVALMTSFMASLGVDTYSEDPICEFLLTQACYPRIGEIVKSIGRPTLFVMEGQVGTSSVTQTRWLTSGALVTIWRPWARTFVAFCLDLNLLQAGGPEDCSRMCLDLFHTQMLHTVSRLISLFLDPIAYHLTVKIDDRFLSERSGRPGWGKATRT